MKNRHVGALLVLTALLGHAGQLHAQRTDIEPPPRKSPEERYEDMRKTPLLAATLEWIVPTVGHDYAGDREAGRPMGYLMLTGAAVFVGVFTVGHFACYDPAGSIWVREDDWGWGCDMLGVVAMAALASVPASRVWASVSAWKLAKRTNAFYRRRLNLDGAGLALSVTPGRQLGLGVSLRF